MKKLLFFLMAILFAIQGLQAQTVTIGTGTAGIYSIPVNTYYNYSYTQQIFTAAEIGTQVGVIQSISFQYFYATAQTKNNVSIYLGNTTKTNFSSTTDWVPVSSMDQVFTGSVNFTNSGTNNWVTIQFDSPFFWDGTSNIVVAVLNNHGTYTTSSNNTFYSHSNTDYKTLRYQEDTNPINIQNSYTGTREYPRNNVQLTFGAPPTCPKPSTLSFTNLLPNSFDVSWIENGTATEWVVEYKLLSETDWTNAISSNVYISNTSISGLSSNTQYEVRVKSICGVGDESTWRTGTIRTPCDLITSLPYSDSFDTYTTGTTIYPACWKKITSNSSPYISATNSSAPGSMYFYTASGAYNYAITPGFDLSIPINTLTAYFKLYKGSAAYNITVGVMTDPTNMSTFDSIANLTPTAITTWQTFSVDFANYMGTGQYIAFKVQGFGAANSMYVDDLYIMTTPSCNIPTGLTRTASTPTSMELDWSAADDANCAGWIVEYKPYDATVWQSEYTTSHPFTISNLISNIVYSIRVKAVCAAGDTTFATNTVNYGLPCEPISVFPWEEGFENVWFTGNGYGGTTDSRPWCWYNVNGGASTSYLWRRTTTASYVRSGLASLQMYTGSTTSQLGDWMITPAFTFTGNERIRFWAKGYSTYTDNLTIKIFDVTTNSLFDAVADTSLFVTIMPNTVIPAATWTQYEINLSQYVGDYQIAFVRNTTGGYYLNIDDIIIDAIPSCPDIAQLSLLSSTATDVTLNWTFNTNAGLGFEISYANVNTGFDPNTGTIISVPDGTTLPYVISNLTPGQFYSFAVRQACNGNWSNIVVTNTDGLPAVLPYSCDFSDVNEQASWKISNGNAVNKFFIGTPTNVNAPISGANLFISNDNGVTNAYTNTAISTAIASRLIEFDGSGGYTLNFDLYMGGESSFDYIKVFLTDPDTTFLGDNTKPYYAINTYNGNNQLLTNYNNAPYFNAYNGSTTTAGSFPREIVLPYQGPAGTVKRLIILWANDGSGGTPPPASIDNIVIEALTCPIPTNVATNNLTSISTDIVWVDPSGTATEWIVKWKPVASTTWDIAISNATTHSLSNLTINTAYNVSIATVCGSDTSIYANFYFVTPCADITIPYIQNFDAVSGFPTCWTRKQGATNPATSTSYLVSSPNSLYFYASGTYQYAATPPVDINVAMNTLQVTFKQYRTTSTYTGIKVGVMTDPNNMATFEQIGNTVTTSALSTWEDKIVLLNSYTGTGRYIALVCDGQIVANGSYLDNFEISVIPSCPKPTQLAVTNVLPNSVDLNWLENGTATTWNIEYGPTGFTQGSGTLLSGVTSMPYTLGGLTPQTTYQFYVQADCGGGDLSLWSTVKSFTTACLPVTTVPYTENFDTYGSTAGTFPTCWFRPILNTTTPWPSIVTTYSVSAPTSLKFQSAAADQPTYAITPQLDVDINTLRVLFKLKAESITSSGTMHIGVMSDPSIPSTFELVQIITPTNTNFNDYEISFANTTLTGTGKYIAFKHVTVSSVYYYWLDNVVVDLIPSCAKPTQLASTNVTQTGANISWLPGNAGDAAWWLYYKSASATSFDSVQVFASPYTLTNLNPSTVYQYYMRTDCGTELSEATASSYFTTLCGNIMSLPFMDNFDSYGTGTTVMPTCWTRINTYTVGDRPYVNTGGRVANCLYFFTGTAGTYNIAVMPPMDLSIALNTLRVKFYAKNYSSTDRMVIGVMSDPTLASTFVPVDTIAPTSAWLPYEVYLNSYVGSGTHIAFKNEYTTTSSYGYIDDLEIDYIPSCAKPTQVTASNITINSASIAWVPGNATDNSWWIYWKQASATTYDSVLVNTNPYTLPGLSPATTYQLYMKTDCGTELSEATNPIAFTTPCVPITSVPYVEYFDTYTTGTAAYPTCWSKLTSNATYPYISATNISTPGSLYLYSSATGGYCHAITPMFDATIPINTLKAEFKLRNGANDDTLYVGVMTDPTDLSTFVLVQKLIPTATATWQDMEVFFNTYNGTGQYIAFKNVYTTTTTTIYVDNLEIFTIPTCPRPTQLVSSNSTSTSTTLSWTEAGSATSWNIEYGPIGFTQGSGTTIPASSNPFILNGLTHSSCYDFYVQAVCSPTDLSVWSNKGTFCTAQITANVPFNIDFETPSGVQIANNISGNNWYIGSDTANTVNNTTGGQNALYVSNDNGQTNAFTITTAAVVWAYRDVYFTPSTADYTFSFNWKGNGEGTTTAYDYLSVYIGTPTMPVVSTTSTITVPTGSDTIVTKLRLQPTWQTATFTMPTASYSGQIKRIYFMWRNDGSGGTQPPASVDNISITSTGISTCLPPTNLTSSSITPTSAQISWTAGGTETAWELDYKLASTSTWTTVPVSINATHLLNTLLPVSTYEVRVRAVCGASEFSGYTPIHTFTTTNTPCDVPTNLQVTNITDQSALATWNAGTAISWQVEYKLVSSANWTSASTTTPSFQISGLQSSSNYEVRVKAICSSNESAFTTNVPFTTTGGTVTYTITATAGANGTITPSGAVTVNQGASQTFNFAPSTGYIVSVVTVDGSPITGAPTSYTFTNVSANRTIHVDFISGISENELEQLVELFPNPTTSTIELRLKSEDLHVKECKIYDMYGKLMKTIQINAETTSIDVTDFASGVYFVRMDSERGTISKKFVKK